MANVEHVLAANVHAAAERLASCNHLGPHGSFDEYAWCPRCGAVRLKVATIEGDPWQRPALVSALARVLAPSRPFRSERASGDHLLAVLRELADASDAFIPKQSRFTDALAKARAALWHQSDEPDPPGHPGND